MTEELPSEVTTPIGSSLAPDWDMKPLVDLCSKIGSGATPKGGAAAYVSSGVSFIRSQNVFDHYFSKTGLAYIDNAAAEKLANVELRPRDVLLNITGDGDTIARCCVVPREILPARVSQHVLVIRSREGLVPEFLQRYLSHPSMREFMLNHNSGGSRRALTKGLVEGFKVVLPPVYEQRAIAEVLGALDDKIAANTKLVDTASDLMVSLLMPYPTSVPLSEIVVHRKKSTSPESIPDNDVAHFSLPAFDVDQCPEICDPASIKSSKFSIEQPSVLISKLNPRFPRIWDVATLPDIPALASTEFLVLEPKDESTAVIWTLLSQPSFSASLETQVAGTSSSHQRVKPNDLLATLVPDPGSVPVSVRQQLTALGSRIAIARSENVSLAATRDALLPQLMSGKLRVKDAEKVLENAGV